MDNNRAENDALYITAIFFLEIPNFMSIFLDNRTSIRHNLGLKKYWRGRD